jgi:hypothetical protein
MQWLKEKTNKLNQRREDNAMAKRKRQDKQTVNQRREDNAMAKRQDKQTKSKKRRQCNGHCIVFSSLI